MFYSYILVTIPPYLSRRCVSLIILTIFRFSRKSFQAVPSIIYWCVWLPTSYRLSSITNWLSDITWWTDNWNEAARYFMREIQLSVNCIFIDVSIQTIIGIHNRVSISSKMPIITIIIRITQNRDVQSGFFHICVWQAEVYTLWSKKSNTRIIGGLTFEKEYYTYACETASKDWYITNLFSL